MAILGSCELFDFLYWEVENQELADYVRKSVTKKQNPALCLSKSRQMVIKSSIRVGRLTNWIM